MSKSIVTFLNTISLGCVVIGLYLATMGNHDDAGFLVLLAIYIDGRLFLAK